MIDIPDENPDLESIIISDQDKVDREFIGKNVVINLTGVCSEGAVDN